MDKKIFICLFFILAVFSLLCQSYLSQFNFNQSYSGSILQPAQVRFYNLHRFDFETCTGSFFLPAQVSF